MGVTISRAKGATSLPKARGPHRACSLGWEIGVKPRAKRLIYSQPQIQPHPHPENQQISCQALTPRIKPALNPTSKTIQTTSQAKNKSPKSADQFHSIF